jgi:DNA-binding transcriptional ArsR family regulator
VGIRVSLRINRRYHRIMRSNAPALFPVFRSTAQAEILAATLLHPDREQTVTDMSRQLEIPLATVSDEVARLVDARILTARKVGRSNLLRANPDNRLVSPLTEIVLATMGPHLVVREAFAGMRGVSRLLIYGSWAARYHGQSGPPPNDLDLLVVGKPDRASVYEAADATEQRTGLTVNPVIASVKRWNDDSDPLITQIKSSPRVEIDLRPLAVGA